MKLVTKLKIFGLFTITLLVIIGFITSWRASQVDLAIERNKIATEIVKKAFILTILNDDYIRTRGIRAETQWKSQHTELSKSIVEYSIHNNDERRIIDKLTLDQRMILNRFSQLQQGILEQDSIASSSARLPILYALVERLKGQLALDMQKIVASASNLVEINDTELSSVRQMTYMLLIGAIIFLGISLILTYLFLAQSISNPISKLTEGTRALAEGNLDFQVDIKSHDEFGELADSFNTMSHRLKELDQAKDQFITLTSHELRTPMTSIRGFVSMILKGDYGVLSDQLRRPLTYISTASEKQIKLINNLLIVSRIQTCKIEYQKMNFSLVPIIENCIKSFKSLVEQKKIQFTTEPTPDILVHADSEWVKEIIQSILDNAFKFTEKGAINIAYRIEPNQIIVVVADTGIGINQEKQQKLFHKFQQFGAHSLNKPDGLGLGLYISREIAQNMDCDVRLEKSTPGLGSTFIITLPIATTL